MDDFLKEYIQNILEVQDRRLSDDQIREAVNNLMSNEELWDTFDNFVYDELDHI